jgi:PKD repeat protein
MSVEGPDELETGQTGTFEAEVNPEAERPVEYRWDFGDGAAGSGLMASHAFESEGEYTVTFTASNEANSASETLTVSVVPPPAPAAIATINATPSPAEAGQRVRFSSNVRGDTPLEYTWNFGDGASGSGSAPTHTYEEAGTYRVTLTAANEVGEDSRSLTLEVEPALAPICMEVSEMNAAYFGRNSSTLTDEGRTQLQENLDILSQCPNLSVRVEGYASPFERNTEALSEDRARAVAQFYTEGGVPSERVMTAGEGEVEGVTSKKGGTDQFRRADSIPQRSGM